MDDKRSTSKSQQKNRYSNVLSNQSKPLPFETGLQAASKRGGLPFNTSSKPHINKTSRNKQTSLFLGSATISNFSPPPDDETLEHSKISRNMKIDLQKAMSIQAKKPPIRDSKRVQTKTGVEPNLERLAMGTKLEQLIEKNKRLIGQMK